MATRSSLRPPPARRSPPRRLQPPGPQNPLPSIDASDLWLVAATALRGIHPLAYVRFTLHSAPSARWTG